MRCFTLDKSDQPIYVSYFMDGGPDKAFPKRWGYMSAIG